MKLQTHGTALVSKTGNGFQGDREYTSYGRTGRGDTARSTRRHTTSWISNLKTENGTKGW